MKLLLLNENPVVSKLINLSAGKMSYELEELSAYNGQSYDIIIVDSDIEADLELLRQNCSRLIFLAPRNQTCEVEAEILYKPFLPTDFLNLLNNKVNVEAQILNDENTDESFDSLSDSFNVEDALETNENSEENTKQELELEDLSLDEDNEKGPDLNLENASEEEMEFTEESKVQEELKTDESPVKIDEGSSSEELEENAKEEEENSKADFLSNDDEEPSPVVEEKEIDFDDLPDDAEFLGHTLSEDTTEKEEEFEPHVEEELTKIAEDEPQTSAQEQIKDELAQLDEMDLHIPQDDGSKILEDFKDKPILDDESLGVSDEELVVPKINEENDFDSLDESHIKQALGESMEDEFAKSEALKEDQNENIMQELSQSIAGAITSSIKDDTLKAALRGMNMKININISFDEDRH